MRIFVRFFLLLSLIFTVGCVTTPSGRFSSVPTDFIAWQSFNERAVWYSSTSKKPILLHFYTENCLACDQANKQLFSNRDIVLTINNYFTPIRLNSKSNKTKQLMQKFGVGVPSVVILSHVDRSVLSKITGVPAPVFFFNNLKISLQMDRVKAIQGVLIGE